MMRTFTLPEALLHELLVYLSRQPYRDVNRLITELAALPEVGSTPVTRRRRRRGAG